MTYRSAIEFIVSRRRDDLAEADAYLKTLLVSDPEFAEAELAFRAAGLDYAHGKIPEEEYLAAEKRRDEVSARKGYTARLNPPPHCSLCGDRGMTGGEICECARKLAIESDSDNIGLPLHDFSEFEPLLYPEDARDFIISTAAVLETSAEKGGSASRKNINLIGGPGTGKTFLASCFISASLERGRNAVFVTAFEFVRRALDYHKGNGDALIPLIDCDVLAIDDLGTESILRNVTLEYLYLVINERQLKGRTTLITSNLSMDEISARYGERLCSRLFDKRLCYTREFRFEDLRKINL